MTKQEAIEILEMNESWLNLEPKFIKEAIDVLLAESKKEIDFDKLRDEFFRECVMTIEKMTNDGYSVEKKLNLAPHDMFEWFKKKING